MESALSSEAWWSSAGNLRWLFLLHTKTANFFQITTKKMQTNKQKTSYNSSSSSSLYKTNSVHKKKLCYFFSKLPPPREHHLHNINKANQTRQQNANLPRMHHNFFTPLRIDTISEIRKLFQRMVMQILRLHHLRRS